jgi:hypothetical protein
MNNLVICPVGNPITFDPRFDRDFHWRNTVESRLYETLVFSYNDFEVEKYSYDFLIKEKGFKWSLAKNYFNNNKDYLSYEYIAFFDDDLITDVHNLNSAFLLAKEKNMKCFQLSVTEDSDIFYPILKNKEGVKYTRTNFIEVMGAVIHSSLIPLCLELWNRYDIYSGWGFDKVLSDLTKEDCFVIHSSKMFHPKKESSYNKQNAFSEMDLLLNNVFPKFMKEKYNEDWCFNDSQIEKEIILEV